jgi:hypothetical protein
MAMTDGGGPSFLGYLEPITLSQDEAGIQFPSNIIICNRNRGSKKLAKFKRFHIHMVLSENRPKI